MSLDRVIVFTLLRGISFWLVLPAAYVILKLLGVAK